MSRSVTPPPASAVVDLSSTRRVVSHEGRREALTRLDALLFRPARFFTVDHRNVRVAGVWPATAATALELVGHGGVAAIVGELREGVRAVDIDLDDPTATTVRQALTAWARHRRLACLVRPSGRPGHAHVFLVGLDEVEDVAALEDECARLRVAHAVPHAAIHPRAKIRTLTSPHKAGLPCPQPLTDPRSFLAAAEAALTTPRSTTPRSSTSRPRSAARAVPPAPARRLKWGPVTAEAAIPRPRPRRDLPTPWATYLSTGQRPEIGGADHSSTTYEAVATASMVRAGWTPDEAWAAIVTAHPDAMTRARANRARWITYVWNRAVGENEDGAAGDVVDEDLVLDLVTARRRGDRLAAGLAPRARYAPLLVLDTLLERMRRTRSSRVPAPERDLHEDCGLDRGTIRAALALLDAGDVLTLDRTRLDRRTGRATTSYEAVLPAGDVDENATPAEKAVWENPPPSRHTPSPWATLPRSAHRLHRTLTLAGPQALLDLAVAALLTNGPIATSSEARTALAGLRALAAAGLVSCDAEGTWSATRAPVTPEVAQHAARDRAARTQVITAERALYRSRGASDWDLARAAAHKAQRAKERAWWRALPLPEREARRAAWQNAFASSSLADQAKIKDSLARRRRAAGVDEAAHHQQWTQRWSPQAWAERTAQRQAAHHARPRPIQIALIGMWEHHRAAWGLPRGRAAGIQTEHDEFTPHGATDRDAAFLRDQLPLLAAARSTA